MSDWGVESLEEICVKFYQSTDANERSLAEKALLNFLESDDCLRRCMLLLERGKSEYALLVASTTIGKRIGKSSSGVAMNERLELRSYLLNYLGTRKLPPFVVNSLCQVFAKVTKLGWFDFQKEDEYVFRNSISDILDVAKEGPSGSNGPASFSLALSLLLALVTEMNTHEGCSSLPFHRKTASAFRDKFLFDVFQCAVKLLTDVATNAKGVDLSDSFQRDTIMQLLRLCYGCLSFDFIGGVDDSADDGSSVQIPTTWRSAFVDGTLVSLLFALLDALAGAPEPARLVLGCLVQVASVRRTMFNNTERIDFLSTLMAGTLALLENPQKIQDPSVYHEMCRLLSRLKTNYQLIELLKVDSYYAKFIELVATFTVNSLQAPSFSSNSIHYLLQFWQRIISSMPYVRDTGAKPHRLEVYAPAVTKAFIESRLDMVPAVVRDALDDPLDDHASVSQQLDQLATICRCEYDKTCVLLVRLFDGVVAQYQRSLNANAMLEVAVEEGCLTWLVLLIGSAIGGRIAFSTMDEHDEVDGDLICRVLQLMSSTDARLPSAGSAKLERSYLWFLDQFRKIYLADQHNKPQVLVVGGAAGGRHADPLEGPVHRLLLGPTHGPARGDTLPAQQSYWSRLLSLTSVPKEKQWKCRLKGINACFAMLKNALTGGYVNFGVFRLYGDASLDDALAIFVKLLLTVPLEDLLAYNKLSCNYYFLLDCLAQDHMAFFSSLEPPVFLYVLQSLLQGLTALDSMICTGTCATLDHILSYIYQRMVRNGEPLLPAHPGLLPEGNQCLQAFEMHQDLLTQMLQSLFMAIMWEECRNQWSMSRPLLLLVLLNEARFEAMTAEMVRGYPEDKRPGVQAAFAILMEGVERSLSAKNRDRFTQNLCTFRREVQAALKGSNAENMSMANSYSAAQDMYS